MFIKICIVCGKEFVKRLSGVNIFCSRNCLYAHQDKRKTTTCLGCNSFGKWKRRFCSLNCYHKWQVGKSNNSLTKFKKGQKSWIAGKKLSPNHYQKLKDAGFFKSKFGNKSGNWKGGRTPLGAAIRTTSEYRNWRKSVFERDGYKCINCGGCHVKGDRRQLHCHHIIPFYKILSDDKISNLDDARKCIQLWDINNGQTLCIPCHKQTDSYLINQYNK